MLPRLLLALLLTTAQGIGTLCGLTHATADGGHVHESHESSSAHASIADGIIELGAHCDTCGSLVSAVLPAPRPVQADVPPVTAPLVPPAGHLSMPVRIDAAARARAPPSFS